MDALVPPYEIERFTAESGNEMVRLSKLPGGGILYYSRKVSPYVWQRLDEGNPVRVPITDIAASVCITTNPSRVVHEYPKSALEMSVGAILVPRLHYTNFV